MSKPELTLLFDGGCPLCLREVRFLQQRDRRRHGEAPRLAFVDIDADNYDPAAYQGISYREAMGRIHAIDTNGTVLRDVEVFRQAYAVVGLGWIYAPSRWPLLAELGNWLYGIWASRRLAITGRPSIDQLCQGRRSCQLKSDGATDLQPTAPPAKTAPPPTSTPASPAQTAAPPPG